MRRGLWRLKIHPSVDVHDIVAPGAEPFAKERFDLGVWGSLKEECKKTVKNVYAAESRDKINKYESWPPN
jgi:hypothetical protein